MRVSRRPFIFSLAAMLAVGSSACETTEMIASEPTTLPTLDDVTEAQWAKLRGKEIFFGHQSVGNNLMDGVKAVLEANPHIGISLLESKNLTEGQEPALHHAKVGRNYYPREKIEEFVRVAREGFGDDGGIAMLKFCFVDVEREGTVVEELFEEYRAEVEALRAANPNIMIVHFTMPLMMSENWKGILAKTLRRQQTERERNVLRNRYNELLEETYAGKEPIFDIAAMESTLPDGNRIAFRHDGKAIPAMAPMYSSYGGHLNEEARRMMGEQLLILLAQMES